MSVSFLDFYIGYKGHPRFRRSELVEDDIIRVIIQKYEMILFTNKGDLLGDPNFGGDLPHYLHSTRVSAETVEGNLRAQIADYIEEVDNIDYQLKVEFYEDPERYQEVMVIGFKIQDYEVFTSVI